MQKLRKNPSLNVKISTFHSHEMSRENDNLKNQLVVKCFSPKIKCHGKVNKQSLLSIALNSGPRTAGDPWLNFRHKKPFFSRAFSSFQLWAHTRPTKGEES